MRPFSAFWARRSQSTQSGTGSAAASARATARTRGLAQAIRAHANFAEQVPLALLVISFAEVLGSRPLVVHVLGVVLVGARLVSAYALNQSLTQSPQRNFSAAVTQLVVVAASAAIFLAMAGVR